MIYTKNSIMGYKEKYKQKVSNSSKKSLTAATVLIFSVLLLAGGAISATAGAADVKIGSNGITINTGSLDVNGNDVNGVSTLKDQSGDTVASFDDSQNSISVQGGFQLPTGEDAYN